MGSLGSQHTLFQGSVNSCLATSGLESEAETEVGDTDFRTLSNE